MAPDGVRVLLAAAGEVTSLDAADAVELGEALLAAAGRLPVPHTSQSAPATMRREQPDPRPCSAQTVRGVAVQLNRLATLLEQQGIG